MPQFTPHNDVHFQVEPWKNARQHRATTPYDHKVESRGGKGAGKARGEAESLRTASAGPEYAVADLRWRDWWIAAEGAGGGVLRDYLGCVEGADL